MDDKNNGAGIFSSVVRGSFWTYLSTGLTLVFGLLSTIAISRLLDAELWGSFSIALSIVSLLVTLGDLGLNNSAIYFIAKEKTTEGKKTYASVLLRYKLVLVFALSLAVFLATDFIAGTFRISKDIVIASSFYLASLSMLNFAGSALTGLKRFKQNSMANFALASLKLALPVGLIYLGWGVLGAIMGYVAATAVAALFALLLMRRLLTTRPKKVSRRGIFSYGFYVGILGVGWVLVSWLDSVMIGLFMAPIYVGFYRIAVTIATTTAGLVSTVNAVLFPFFIEASGKPERLRAYFDKSIKYLSFFAVPSVAGLALLSGQIVNVLFGSQYADAAAVLAILSYFCFDAMVTGTVFMTFSAFKKPKLMAIIVSVSSVANMLLNLAMIPMYGIVGAALASIMVRVASFIAGVYLLKRNFGIRLNAGHLVRPIAGSLVMATVVYPLLPTAGNAFSLAAVIAIGAAVYLGAEMLMGFDVRGLIRRTMGSLKG